MAKRPNPALRFAREGPLRTVGHIWWNVDGKWRRYLVRRHAWGDASEVQETHLVESGSPFCPHCLATTVTSRKWEGPTWHECGACGVRWWWLDLPPGQG